MSTPVSPPQSVIVQEAATTLAPSDFGQALTFDIGEYQRFVEDADWTEAQQREFLEAVWQIIVGFVDLGFNLHPIQHVTNGAKTMESHASCAVDSRSISDSKQIAVADRFSEYAGGVDS